MDATWCIVGTKKKKRWIMYENKREYKEYFSEKYKKTMLMPTLLFPTYNRKDKSHWNVKHRKSSRFTCMGTYMMDKKKSCEQANGERDLRRENEKRL